MGDDDPALLGQAVKHHQAGDLPAAEMLYRRVLASNPDDMQALYLLGTVALQRERFAECIELLGRVAASRPEIPDVHNNLGVAYQALDQWEPAAHAFQAAIKSDPDYDRAFFNLGSVMEARRLFADAEKCYAKALDLNPADRQARGRLGNILKTQQKWPEAERCFREYLAQDPGNLDLLVNLAFVLAKQERLDEAADAYHQALARKPDYFELHNSLSYVYERQGKLQAAVDSARRALEIHPEYAEGLNNLGTALRALHRLEEACQCFRKALELNPDFALAEFNDATTRLLQGDYLAGWPGYRRHAELWETPPRVFDQPLWDGGSLENQTLLVYADQGFGDTIQFARFLKNAKERSQATLVFECPPELKDLLANQPGVDKIVAEGSPLPAFDVQTPLANLPGLFSLELDALSVVSSYVEAPRTLRPDLRDLIDGVPADAFTVGIVWQGNPLQARDVVRSCPLSAFLPLAEVPGITLVSLQTDETGLGPLRAIEEQRRPIDLGSRFRDFSETAAAIARLDLIVTVDTAVAHLAGALGHPVWTLLCHTPDWRWHLDRIDSPWYPTMRLFRQPCWGDWDAVIADVAGELKSLVDRR